jgi:hypothetical protein
MMAPRSLEVRLGEFVNLLRAAQARDAISNRGHCCHRHYHEIEALDFRIKLLVQASADAERAEPGLFDAPAREG